MQISTAQTEKLLKSNQNFTQFGFSMMMTRLRGIYAKNPTADVVTSSTTEINYFLNKFKAIMDTDYKTIMSL